MKKIIIAITLIVIGSVGVSILSPTISMADDNKPAASDSKCPSGKILTLKPWYDGLMEKMIALLKLRVQMLMLRQTIFGKLHLI